MVHENEQVSAFAPGRFIGSATAELAAMYLCLHKHRTSRNLILVIYSDSVRAVEYAMMEPLRDTRSTRRLIALVSLARDSMWPGVRMEWIPRHQNTTAYKTAKKRKEGGHAIGDAVKG